MIAPISDIRPGVVGFDGFPVKAVFGHSIGIIAVKSARIQEFEYHAFDKIGVGMSKRFPILKNIAPVSFVIQDFRAVFFIAHIDREPVPGPAGIAVPAAEPERHVFQTQSGKVGILALMRHLL